MLSGLQLYVFVCRILSLYCLGVWERHITNFPIYPTKAAYTVGS